MATAEDEHWRQRNASAQSQQSRRRSERTPHEPPAPAVRLRRARDGVRARRKPRSRCVRRRHAPTSPVSKTATLLPRSPSFGPTTRLPRDRAPPHLRLRGWAVWEGPSDRTNGSGSRLGRTGLVSRVTAARRRRAGTPATTLPGSTSRVTTAPAPTSAPAPIATPPSTTAPEPIDAPRSTTVRSSSSRPSVCSAPELAVARGTLVVDEHHAVADEHLVLDRHAVADERVALDLAARADRPRRAGSRRTVPMRVPSPIVQP